MTLDFTPTIRNLISRPNVVVIFQSRDQVHPNTTSHCSTLDCSAISIKHYDEHGVECKKRVTLMTANISNALQITVFKNNYLKLNCPFVVKATLFRRWKIIYP